MIPWTTSCTSADSVLVYETRPKRLTFKISFHRSNIQEQVKQQATAPAKPANQLPEIVSGQFDDDFEFEESGVKSTAASAGGASKGGVTADDLDELDGALIHITLFSLHCCFVTDYIAALIWRHTFPRHSFFLHYNDLFFVYSSQVI